MSITKFKSEVKKIYEKTQNEISERSNYFDSKSENWQESVTGDNYLATTEVIQELFDALTDAVINLGITFKNAP